MRFSCRPRERGVTLHTTIYFTHTDITELKNVSIEKGYSKVGSKNERRATPFISDQDIHRTTTEHVFLDDGSLSVLQCQYCVALVPVLLEFSNTVQGGPRITTVSTYDVSSLQFSLSLPLPLE